MPDTIAAPTCQVQVTPHPSTTQRTRLRVSVRDDGPLPRVHLVVLTTYGETDVALGPEQARVLADAVTAAADRVHQLTTSVEVVA